MLSEKSVLLMLSLSIIIKTDVDAKLYPLQSHGHLDRRTIFYLDDHDRAHWLVILSYPDSLNQNRIIAQISLSKNIRQAYQDVWQHAHD